MTRRGRGSTRTGQPAPLPAGAYESALPVRDAGGSMVVDVRGEDGRDLVLRVGRLPLPGWHQPLAAALAARTGPAGTRRTAASALGVWEPAGRLLRFLDSLTTPPADPAQLTVAHLEAFQRHRARSAGDVYAQHDLGEIIQLLKMEGLRGRVAPGVAAFTCRRPRYAHPEPKPGYSDRELGDQLVKAARSDVAGIRDRVRAAEALLTRYHADPGTLDPAESGRVSLLARMASTGEIPDLPGPAVQTALRRRDIASQLFLTMRDMAPLLVLLVAVTGRNIETIKELPAGHRIIEDRAVELRVVKRRRGQHRWFETVTWEIGPASSQLRTPGGLYLLACELTRRSRAVSGTRLLWSVWRHGRRAGVTGAAEHYGLFDKSLQVKVQASKWADGHGLTADRPAAPGQDGATAGQPERVPLKVDFGRLKTSIDVRRTKQMGGHLPSAARTNSVPVLFRSYLRGDPAIVDWAEQIMGEALADAEQSALAAHQRALDAAGGTLRVIPGPADAGHLHQAGLGAGAAHQAACGELDTAWSGCVDHDAHPATGKPCRSSFLDCFHCGNCLVTRDHLPRLLGLLDAFALRRQQLPEADWWARYGMAWAAIRQDVLTKFSPAEIDQATARKSTDTLLDLVESPWERP